MGFSSESGYTPTSIVAIMTSIMNNINDQFGTSYDYGTFEGTNFFKYFYALAQKVQENEIKTSEVFLKLQQYFVITNEKISRPVVTNPGLIEILENEGYIASVKPMVDEDAGKISICVDKHMEDVDVNWEDSEDYSTDRLAVCNIIKNSTVAGAVTQGDESETIALSNGQSFDFKYSLPNRIEVHLRLTLTLSENNMVLVGDPDEVKLLLLANVRARYSQGQNFEPQKYFQISDAPWASQVLLEWSDDSESNYHSTIFDADFDDLYDVKLTRIHLVEA